MTNIDFPPIIAHRGASAYATENTLRALELVRECDRDWVEFDVQLTHDQQLVVVHDPNLYRLTHSDIDVNAISLADLQKLPLQHDVTGEEHSYIPSLHQWLTLSRKLKLKLNCEIKPDEQNCQRIVALLCEMIAEFGLTNEEIILSSFDIPTLEFCRQQLPDFWIGLNLEHWRKDWQQVMQNCGANSLHLNQYSITEKRVQAVHEAGYKIMAFTVNRKKRAEKLLAMGVDSLFSNYPDLV